MKRGINYSCSLICVILLITITGCVPLLIGAAAGAGSMTYVKGALIKNVDKPVAKVHKASLSAIEGLDLFITSDELNKHSAIIKAEYEDGKKVKVFIDALTERSSKITIRIGTFGDDDRSQVILTAIQKKL